MGRHLARGRGQRHRFEDSSVWTGLPNIAGPCVAAIGDAGYPPENDSHCAAQNVRGFARRKEERLLSDELEP